MQPFCRPSKVLPKACRGKKAITRMSKLFFEDSRASPGLNKSNTRTFEGKKKTKKDIERTCERQPLRESAILSENLFFGILDMRLDLT